MSESSNQVDLSVVDRLKPAFDQLVADLAGVAPIRMETDPVVIAAEVAVLAAGGACGSATLMDSVLRLVRPSATPFERGLAMGMALVLATRPAAN